MTKLSPPNPPRPNPPLVVDWPPAPGAAFALFLSLFRAASQAKGLSWRKTSCMTIREATSNCCPGSAIFPNPPEPGRSSLFDDFEREAGIGRDLATLIMEAADGVDAYMQRNSWTDSRRAFYFRTRAELLEACGVEPDEEAGR